MKNITDIVSGKSHYPQKNIQFELNEKTLTAKVIFSDEIKEYTFIPPLIVHESKKYIVDNLSGSLTGSKFNDKINSQSNTSFFNNSTFAFI